VIGCWLSLAGCGTEDCDPPPAACVHGASIALKSSTGTWDAGAYRFTVEFDGGSHTCQLNVPDELVPAGSLVSVPCEPTGVGLSVIPEVTCHGECTPVPDQFAFEVFVFSTATDVRMRVERDGGVIVEDARSLDYRESTEFCGESGCRTARLELTVPN
jgi:hypothetical protein